MAHLLRTSWRTVVRGRWATLFTVATLGIAMGSNAAVFHVVYSILFRPLPFTFDDELVLIESSRPQDSSIGVMSWPDFLDCRRHARAFTELAAFNIITDQLTGTGEPEEIWGTVVSPSYFSVLGVTPFRGSFFTAESEVHKNPNVVVISHGLWKRRFRSDPSIVGRKLMLSGIPFQVIGIGSPNLRHPEPLLGREAEYWRPLVIQAWMENRRAKFLRVIGRLKKGMALELAQNDIQRSLQASATKTELAQEPEVVLAPLRDKLVGHLKPGLFILITIMIILFAIACGNVANLLLARCLSREKEFQVKCALGTRWSFIFAGFMVETFLLCLLACVLAIFLGYWSGTTLAVNFPEFIPAIKPMRFSGMTVAFTLALSALSFPLISFPSLLRLGTYGRNPLRNRPSSSRGRISILRNALVASEISAALALVIIAALLGQSVVALQSVNPGFVAQNVLTFRLNLPSRYSTPSRAREFFGEVVADLRILPDVLSAGASSSLPFTALNDITMTFNAEGAQVAEDFSAHYQAVDPEYFTTMKIPLLRGRLFTSDDQAESPRVIILSETVANYLWPSRNAVGQRMRFSFGSANVHWMEVVGIVGDVRSLGLTSESPYVVYSPLDQAGLGFASIVVRTRSAPMGSAGTIKEVVHSKDPDLPLADMEEMASIVQRSTARVRFLAGLTVGIAFLALLLAFLGVASVVSYLVGQARREIGIRIALGALESHILNVFVRPMIVLAGLGVVIALALISIIRPLLSPLLFGVSAISPETITITSVVIGMIVVLASYVPARAALRVGPREILREG